MRRAGRWTLNGLTVPSVVLCVGTMVLWVRSYWVSDYWHLWSNHFDPLASAGHDWHLSLTSESGGVKFAFIHSSYQAIALSPPAGVGFQHLKAIASSDPRHLTFSASLLHLGDFSSIAPSVTVADFGGWQFKLPHWVFGIPAIAIALRTWVVFCVRRGDLIMGRCAACHYDLTGNVSGVCPECGTSVAKRIA